MRIQLVGPMSSLPGFNYLAFSEAASRLRELGHEVFSPHETAGGDTTKPRSFYMRASLGGLLHAELVLTLPEWRCSKGARVEVDLARELAIPVVPLDVFLVCAGAVPGRGIVRCEISEAPDD